MISLERLFTLVHSLTKSEKRYFKLSSELQSGAKDYLLLFNVLDNYEIFNKELEKQIRNTFPGSKIEPARKHLYKVIMRSLRLYEGEKNIEIKLMNLLQDSRILFSKGLIDLSLSQLNKIKALAKKQEKFDLIKPRTCSKNTAWAYWAISSLMAASAFLSARSC